MTLIKYEDRNIKARREPLEKWLLSGIECPKCGQELYELAHTVMLTSPPQVEIFCVNSDCRFKGSRIVGSS